MTEERRRFERLHLKQPVDGWFGDFAVRLVDISASGARVDHDEPIPVDSRALLRFFWRGDEIEVLAQITRTNDVQAGVRFLEESPLLVRSIEVCLAELTAALEANARGDRDANQFGDETITSAWRHPVAGYVRWTWSVTGWRSEQTDSPEQPDDGFTIAASEPIDQVGLLCNTYETGDDEARRMTRMLAAMSVVPE